MAGAAAGEHAGTKVVQLAAGTSHTCGVLDSGAVRCWGRGAVGQLGYGSTEDVGDDEAPRDAGDVELSAWQFQPENIQTGVGFGVRANSPVGPVELGVGFGLDRRGDDSLAQVYFNIGPSF